MAPRLRSPTLETRTARLKLKVRRKPYFVPVAPGILGYRRNLGPELGSSAAPMARAGRGQRALRPPTTSRTPAASTCSTSGRRRSAPANWSAASTPTPRKPITVAEALDEYERDLKTRGGLVGPLLRVRAELTPALLDRPVGLLVMRELRRYRDGEFARGLKPSSVTRLCKAFAAALNYAADHDPTIANRAAWKIGLAALPDSHVARVDAILSDDQVRAVVAACYAFSERLGLFVEVLAVTGCRPIQAARLVVGDLQSDRLLMPRSAKGRGKKRIDRRPLPIPPPLMAKLRAVRGQSPNRRNAATAPRRQYLAHQPQSPVPESPGGRRVAAADGAVCLAT